LPVHRHHHDRLGSVYAYKAELDEWRRQREPGADRKLLARPVSRADKTVSAAAVPTGKIRLLVLPFGNLSGDPGQDFLSDGLTDEMITQLGRLEPHRLGVIGRTTAMHYKGGSKRIDQIRDELGVDYMVEGSVRRSADRVRITAQLIRANDQTHLWAETYDRDFSDVLVLQCDVAQRIAREIRVALPAREQARLGESTPVSPEAFEAYLKGRSLWYERRTDSLRKSVEYFQQAIDKEPDYALAHAGLADAYALLAILPWDGLCPADAMPKAKAAALRALEIDDSLAEAYASLAIVLHRYEWDWQRAEQNFKRAIALNPNNARPHLWYGWLLMTAGRREEALVELHQAEEVARSIDPLGIVDICATLAMSMYFARQYDQAIAACRKAYRLNPNFFMTHYVLGRCYAQKRMFAQSIRVLEGAVASGGNNLLLLMALGHSYAAAGRKAKAHKIVEELKDLRKQRYVPSIYLAAICAALRDRDEAFLWLEETFRERSDGMTYVKVERLFDPIRSDRRLEDLMKRVGFDGLKAR
jgi:TolB-like protein/Flp pilus assembly protein TadD